MGNAQAVASGRTGLDLSHEKIVQFSLVVNDAEKVAKRFSEIFSGSASQPIAKAVVRH